MAKDLKHHALSVCRWVLRPLVRMMLKHGVMHREFVELSKELYVDVARNDYGIRGRPTNVSRTALLTGLDRKEVSRVKQSLGNGNSAAETAHRQDRLSRVLAGWHQDPDYLDTGGRPLVLPLEGEAPSYEDLVRRYSGDVPAVTILRELKRVKAVKMHPKKRVEVLRRNYRLATADPSALVRAGSVLADIGRTVTHNLYHDPKVLSRFEARASNTNIPASAIPEYRELIYSESQIFLEKVDAWLSEHEVPDAEAEANKAVRLGVGVYWIQTDNPKGETP